MLISNKFIKNSFYFFRIMYNRTKRRKTMDLNFIKKRYLDSQIKWSAHCLERMQERDISIEDVGECIQSGEIVEDYPDDFPNPSCLVFGYDISGKVIHVVVGTDQTYLYIITSYYPNTDKFMEDLKTRRK